MGVVDEGDDAAWGGGCAAVVFACLWIFYLIWLLFILVKGEWIEKGGCLLFGMVPIGEWVVLF